MVLNGSTGFLAKLGPEKRSKLHDFLVRYREDPKTVLPFGRIFGLGPISNHFWVFTDFCPKFRI